MNRLHPSLLSYDNEMRAHLEQEEDRSAKELFAVIARGEGISEEEAEAIFIEQLGKLPPQKTLHEKIADALFLFIAIALGVAFWFEFAMEASK